MLTLVLAGAGAGEAGPARVRVSDVTLSAPAAGTARVRVALSGQATFTARVAEGGTRLLVDIAGAEVAGAPGAITEGNPIVAGVMTQTFKTAAGEATTRVLIQLARAAEYRVRPEGGALLIDLAAAAKTAPMPAARGVSDSGIAAPALLSSDPSNAPSANQPGEVSITNVRFEHTPGGDRVIVESTGQLIFDPPSRSGGRHAIEIPGARLPDHLQRTLDVGAFGGPVK
ncbi:MAG TPA: AMIN domain-containing protein, partial [Polyangiaceae bacterium]|nr:AMIN domain-containing protein [Polyangiaceae bacterium]